MADNETTADIIADKRFDATTRDQFDSAYIVDFCDRLEAAHSRETDCIHRAMVLLAGIKMRNPDDPPRLWSALDDAYNALSDALGTDGDITADEEKAKASGRHFVIQPRGDCAKLREALKNSNGLLEELAAIGEWGESAREQIAENKAALAAPPRNCDLYKTKEKAQEAFMEEPCDHPCGTNWPAQGQAYEHEDAEDRVEGAQTQGEPAALDKEKRRREMSMVLYCPTCGKITDHRLQPSTRCPIPGVMELVCAPCGTYVSFRASNTSNKDECMTQALKAYKETKMFWGKGGAK